MKQTFGFTNRLNEPVQNTQKEKNRYEKQQMVQTDWAAVLGLMILGFAVPSGQSAPTVTLTAVVQDQRCSFGTLVYVTLTATLSPPTQNVQFQWDLNNDGIFDTPLSPDPTVTRLYPPFATVTAVVKAVKGSRSATDPVTFRTLFCPSG